MSSQLVSPFQICKGAASPCLIGILMTILTVWLNSGVLLEIFYQTNFVYQPCTRLQSPRSCKRLSQCAQHGTIVNPQTGRFLTPQKAKW